MRVNSGKGFTALEMIITMSVIAVLSAAAVPSFIQAQKKAQLKVAAQDLKATLDIAQSETIKTRKPIYVAYMAPDGNSGCILSSDTNDIDALTCAETSKGLPKFHFEHYSGIELNNPPERSKILFYFKPQTTQPSVNISLTLALSVDPSEQAGVLVRPYAGLKGCSSSQFSSWTTCPSSEEGA
ncbi:pilus assembly FimT family protein [Veronia pacifica]|uniref:Prepilin-type N-terminal cleavage/methylation domain-containing protein n=1 Tax=Veronia pacifica TaxID=1080227 RepID=A0A1C3E746_9GAMM|nr:prepilin-type N-terminal cleavage/methylation domain-containing protein [Veronia pacifica]ODA29066.1 hypothetical protein A8L45_22725 [Veronia pacifica]